MDRYFEGTYRRTPQQNLAGASRHYDVSELINKVQNERKKREEARFLQEKALFIQSYVRSYLQRKLWKLSLRQEVLVKIDALGEKIEDLQDFEFIIKRVLFIFPRKLRSRSCELSLQDTNLLMFVVQATNKLQNSIIESMSSDKLWFWRVVSLLSLNFHFLRNLSDESGENLLYIIQCTATFLDVKFYRNLLHSRSPLSTLTEVWGELLKKDDKIFRSIGVRGAPKHDEILEIERCMFQNLIYLINSSDNDVFRQTALKFIGSTFMKPPINPADVLLSTLRNSEKFPLAELAQVYLSSGKDHMTYESLFRFLFLDMDQRGIPPFKQKYYFELLSELLLQLNPFEKISTPIYGTDKNLEIQHLISSDRKLLINYSVSFLDSIDRSNVWINYLNYILANEDFESLIKFCKCVYLLWITEKSAVYTRRIIKKVAFHPTFLKNLWVCMLREKRVRLTSNPPQSFPIYQILSHGVLITLSEADRILPALTMFCFFLKHHLAILNDDLFYEEEHHERPDFVQFKCSEIRDVAGSLRDIAVGVISLAFPTFSFDSHDPVELATPTDNVSFNIMAWRSLLAEMISLLRLIYIRDSHRQFTSDGFWISLNVTDVRKSINTINTLDLLVPFSSALSSSRSFNVYEVRYLATLRCLPFVIEFLKRFMLLQHLITESKTEYQNPNLHFLHSSYVLVQIRRDYIYEDAFDKLNIDEVPECRIQVKVHLINALGMEEAGIDGGGLFREFIIELLKTAFDPNRGFFLMNEDNELYPNPNIECIVSDFTKHYVFIGRMLGKALYENILVEIPLAEFFLVQLLEAEYGLHLSGLASLDPDLYKNLLYLLTYNDDFSNLELDFTVSHDYFGTNKVIELKPNGSNIPVTKDNVLEYIHLVARHKTDDQIARQTAAFLEGLTSVIPQQWISMFSTKELQLIISGNETPIDIVDMKENVVYAGGYSENHPTIELFWRVLSSLDSNQKSQLLKFVTSCSRPPLLGFKELYPPFCIQFVENDTMLPSASTCMNILKLPNFQDADTMRQKILYAINSGAGFELT